jgi:hypothetical protein
MMLFEVNRITWLDISGVVPPAEFASQFYERDDDAMTVNGIK